MVGQVFTNFQSNNVLKISYPSLKKPLPPCGTPKRSFGELLNISWEPLLGQLPTFDVVFWLDPGPVA